MNPITIAYGLEIIAQLIAAMQAAQAAGSEVVPQATWDAAVRGRKFDQAQFDADIAAERAAGR